ncbi:MAG: hypothetical protein IT383_02085 [Deltaproteobacteria bacterium]|nr:hypothetical protein [Deltaproteobacteria bacterium]
MAKKKKSKDDPKPAADKLKGMPEPASDRPRVLALLAIAGALGIAAGALVVGRLPISALLSSAKLERALDLGDGAALAEAAARDRDDPDELARGALVDALLLVDFGGGAVERERLAGLAKANADAKTQPEALLARAIGSRLGADADGLDAEIAAAGGGTEEGTGSEHPKKGEHPNDGGDHPKGDGKKDDDNKDDDNKDDKKNDTKDDDKKDDDKKDDDNKDDEAATVHPAVFMARATRELQRGHLDEAWTAAQRAALRPDAPAYTSSAAARIALARREPGTASVFAERALARSPGNGMALALLVTASVFDGPSNTSAAARDDDDDDTPKNERAKGGRPEEHDGAAVTTRGVPVSAAETRAARAAADLSPRDAAVVAWTLEALALARGDGAQAQAHGKRVLAEAPKSSTLAARQAELALLGGDLAAAEEHVTAALKGAAADPELLLARARVRAMRQLPPDALKPDGRATGAAADSDALVLPFGRLVLDATAPGLPWRVELDPMVAPDVWLRAEYAAGAKDLEGRLGVIENVWKAEHALLRGDVAAAAEAATSARAKAPQNPDVLLVDARTRLLKGDREGMRAALKDAVAASNGDPRVPLTATRIGYDAEDLALTRTYLDSLERTGFKSPAALALGAVLAAREGNARAAQAAIKEAETLSPDDLDVLRGRLVLARLAGNLAEVRKQADRALAVDDARSPDPLLRAWEGEALFRKGEGERAQAVLAGVLAARPGLIDAHLAMGIALAGPKPLDAAASFAQAIQIGGDAAIVAEATKRRAAIAGAPPLK